MKVYRLISMFYKKKRRNIIILALFGN